MIDTATKASGEEYLAYNKRRWGSDSWTHHLRAQVPPNPELLQQAYTATAHCSLAYTCMLIFCSFRLHPAGGY